VVTEARVLGAKRAARAMELCQRCGEDIGIYASCHVVGNPAIRPGANVSRELRLGYEFWAEREEEEMQRLTLILVKGGGGGIRHRYLVSTGTWRGGRTRDTWVKH
jgi:hypothetical protein